MFSLLFLEYVFLGLTNNTLHISLLKISYELMNYNEFSIELKNYIVYTINTITVCNISVITTTRNNCHRF